MVLGNLRLQIKILRIIFRIKNAQFLLTFLSFTSTPVGH